MGSSPWEGVLPPAALRQIGIKARTLAGHYGFGRSDEEDLADELAMAVWQRLPKFDAAKGDLNTFLYWLVEKAAATLVERQSADKRGGGRRTRSLDHPIQGAEGSLTTASEVMDQTEAGRRLGLDPQHFTNASNLTLEFQTFANGLRADLRDLFERMLQNPSLTDISRETGIPRGTLYERRQELQALMEQAGLREYHASSGASASPPVEEE